MEQIWQVADTEDKGFVTTAGFYVILRLIGHAQAGRPIRPDVALKGGLLPYLCQVRRLLIGNWHTAGGPLPRFEGINVYNNAPVPLQPQASGGPIRVPPLAPDRASQYAALFESSGAQNGALPGQSHV